MRHLALGIALLLAAPLPMLLGTFAAVVYAAAVTVAAVFGGRL